MQRLLRPGERALERPLYIHGLWRSGSTYVWQKFREQARYRAYYEPLHELLATIGPVDLARDDLAATARGMRHPAITASYFAEYPLARRGGVASYRKSFAYDDYFLAADADHPELKTYLEGLLEFAAARNQRPVLQFCRTGGRLGWLRRHCDGYHVYLLRNPRDQWQSCLTSNRAYFLAVVCAIVARAPGEGAWQRLWPRFRLPLYMSAGFVGDEYEFYSTLADVLSYEESYLLFYAVWLAALLQALAHAELIVDMSTLPTDDAVIAKLRDWNVNLDFSDFDLRRYEEYALGDDAFVRIESRIDGLWVAHEPGLAAVREAAAQQRGHLPSARATLARLIEPAPADSDDDLHDLLPAETVSDRFCHWVWRSFHSWQRGTPRTIRIRPGDLESRQNLRFNHNRMVLRLDGSRDSFAVEDGTVTATLVRNAEPVLFGPHIYVKAGAWRVEFEGSIQGDFTVEIKHQVDRVLKTAVISSALRTLEFATSCDLNNFEIVVRPTPTSQRLELYSIVLSRFDPETAGSEPCESSV